MEEIEKWTRVTGASRDQLRGKVAKLYAEQGLSIRAIAKETGRSYGAIYRLLDEAEVTLRPRGNPKVALLRQAKKT